MAAALNPCTAKRGFSISARRWGKKLDGVDDIDQADRKIIVGRLLSTRENRCRVLSPHQKIVSLPSSILQRCDLSQHHQFIIIESLNMAKPRTKKRTHVGANNPVKTTENNAVKTPKSFVIRIGAGGVGSSVSQLTADVRRVLEPNTASRLKERRANRLKDYVVMAGPLGITHLLLFSRSESGNTNLRIALSPRGPTMNFRVEKYSLAKDVQNAQRRPKGSAKEQLAPPLVSNLELHLSLPKHS